MNLRNNPTRAMAIVAACVSIGFGIARCQERTLSLPEAIDLALQHNREVQIAKYKVSAEVEKKRGAGAAYYPKVTNQSSLLHVSDLQRVEIPAGALGSLPGGSLVPSANVFLPQGEETLETSGTEIAQPITQLIKIRDANRIAAADVGIAQASLRNTSIDVIYSVHQLYYGILSAQSQRKAAELQLVASKEGLAEAGEQLKNGSLLQSAVVEAQANSLEAKQTLLTVDMQLSDLTIQLDDLLGLPLDTKPLLDPNVDMAFNTPTREDALRTATLNNPEVQSADKELAKARAAQGAAKAEYIPDLTGFARHSYQNGVSFVDHNFGTFGVMFSYDLFDAGKRHALVRERKDEVSEAEENLERAKEALAVRIATTLNAIETTRNMVDVAKEVLAARRANASLAEDQFKQGTILASQRDSSRALEMKAQAALLSANLEYQLAKDKLAQTLGTTVK
jgi:outer membrane protein TolC